MSAADLEIRIPVPAVGRRVIEVDVGEQISFQGVLAGEITVTLARKSGRKVRLVVSAPDNVKIMQK